MQKKVGRSVKESFKYVAHFLAKVLWFILPRGFLLPLLRVVYTIPKIGSKIVTCFDPNDIGKTVGFNFPERSTTIKGAKWTLKIDTSSHVGYRSYIRNEPFEMAVYHIAEKLKSNGRSVIVDIGAHIGTASIPTCSSNNFELIALEASKSNGELLMKNVADNDVRAKIYLFALVEHVSSEYQELFVNRGNTGMNSLHKEWGPFKGRGGRETELVPTTTLDRIIQESGINIDDVLLTKIDVEGMEEAVLRGGQSFLTKNTSPILLEYRHDAAQKIFDGGLDGLCEILARNDYEIFSLDNKNFDIHSFEPTLSYENVIALKKSSGLKNFFMPNCSM